MINSGLHNWAYLTLRRQCTQLQPSLYPCNASGRTFMPTIFVCDSPFSRGSWGKTFVLYTNMESTSSWHGKMVFSLLPEFKHCSPRPLGSESLNLRVKVFQYAFFLWRWRCTCQDMLLHSSSTSLCSLFRSAPPLLALCHCRYFVCALSSCRTEHSLCNKTIFMGRLWVIWGL